MLKPILNKTILLLLIILWAISAKGQSADNKGLKDYYAGYFPIGTYSLKKLTGV